MWVYVYFNTVSLPQKAPHPGDPDGKRYGLIATGIA